MNIKNMEKSNIKPSISNLKKLVGVMYRGIYRGILNINLDINYLYNIKDGE